MKVINCPHSEVVLTLQAKQGRSPIRLTLTCTVVVRCPRYSYWYALKRVNTPDSSYCCWCCRCGASHRSSEEHREGHRCPDGFLRRTLNQVNLPLTQWNDRSWCRSAETSDVTVSLRCARLNEEARKLIADLGSSAIKTLGFRDSWVFVGAKGATESNFEKVPEALTHTNVWRIHIIESAYSLTNNQWNN